MASAKKFAELRNAETGAALVQFFCPGTDRDIISVGLRILTHQLTLLKPEAHRGDGIFGGEYGYGIDFENDIFLMRPYNEDQGCTCGFTEVAETWHEANPHSAGCYSSVRNQRIKEWKLLNPEPGYRCDIFTVNGTRYDSADEALKAHFAEGGEFQSAMSAEAELRYEHWRRWYDQRQQAEEVISRTLCSQLEISWDDGKGSAIHCTCGKKQRAETWFAENDHDPRCPIALPNFWFKPLGFRVEWYKYIGRDNVINKPIGVDEWINILREVLASIDGPTLDAAVEAYAKCES